MHSTHRTEAEARNQSLVEEAVREESYGGHGVDDGEHIVELKWTFPGSVVGLELSEFHRNQSENQKIFFFLSLAGDPMRIWWDLITSCMCQREACHRALWAHLAQNSIPTCAKVKLTAQMEEREPEEEEKKSTIDGKRTAAPTESAKVPNISDRGTSPPWKNQTQSQF